MRVALNSQYLFVLGARPIPANQNVKYQYFHCAFQIEYEPKQMLPFWRQALPGAERRRQTLSASAALDCLVPLKLLYSPLSMTRHL